MGLIMTIGCSRGNTDLEKEILNTFNVADGFQLELVAIEPLISDPVAMEIDENGDIYVVEMHGYPLNTKGSGLVKKLYDDDGDGSMDRSEVYYDQLVLPTGIMKWKEGVLVTDPPDLLYLEDTNADGKADKREVVLTGFALSNPQHNFNNPIYGLDNWIYLANEGTYKSKGFEDLFGDEGGEIHFPDDPEGPRLPRNAEDLNVKLDPLNGRLEMLSSSSQFGHTFDNWGHHFMTTNWSHIYQEVLGAQYAGRNKNLPLSSSMQYVPDYGIGFEIFPITENPEHQLLTSVGAITSSCGITWYLGDLFPDPYNEVVFIAEPSHNLVHTDIMYENGAAFASKSQFETTEFLASKDAWFRPVNFYVGPDGAMYLLDFHRKIIEHPEWISEEVLNSGDLYQGLDKGRIFRIIPTRTTATTTEIDLGQATPEELILQLQNPNIWWRRHAQRLLVFGQNKSLVPALKEFINSATALGVLHGLWTLDGLGHFDKELALKALDHSSPGVRENAIRIAELHRKDFPELEEKLIPMVDDLDSKVRFQLLLTLGYFQSSEAKKARRQLLFKDVGDPWMQLAGLSAAYVDELALYEEALKEFDNNFSTEAESLIINLSKSIGNRGEEIDELLKYITRAPNTSSIWWQTATIKGLTETIKPDITKIISKNRLRALESFFVKEINPELRTSSIGLLNSLGYFNRGGSLEIKAKSVVINSELDHAYRMDAVKILSLSDADRYSDLFQRLIGTEEQEDLRIACILALAQTTGTQECKYLIDIWKDLTPAERDQAVAVFQTNVDRQLTLLEAIGSGLVQSSTLGWSRTVGYLNSSNDQVRELARTVLEGNESISDSLWQDYQNVLTLDGNPIKGASVYERSCGICHQLGGDHGISFGPDLATISNRNKSGIMIDILKPNRSISDGYNLWTIQDKSNGSYSGVISKESANSITLKDASGEETVIRKSDIKNKIASEISAMPEGLHNQITHQEMADLLEYLKNGK